MQPTYMFCPIQVSGIVRSQGTNDTICVSIFRSSANPFCFSDLTFWWQYWFALYPKTRERSPLSSLPGFPFPSFTPSQFCLGPGVFFLIPSSYNSLSLSLALSISPLPVAPWSCIKLTQQQFHLIPPVGPYCWTLPSPQSYLKGSLWCPNSSLLRFGADACMLVRAMNFIWHHRYLYIYILTFIWNLPLSG